MVRTRGLKDEIKKVNAKVKEGEPKKKPDYRKNDKKILDWGADDSEENMAYKYLRDMLLNPLSLYPADMDAKNGEFHVYCDSSSRSRGGILLQRIPQSDGSFKTYLIDFYSRSIGSGERWSSILKYGTKTPYYVKIIVVE